jgi:hypothetical protein
MPLAHRRAELPSAAWVAASGNARLYWRLLFLRRPETKSLDIENGGHKYCGPAIMGRLARRCFLFLAILTVSLTFLTVSTAALAHGHSDPNNADESHCVMCMAGHSATHLVTAPAIALHFSPVRIGLVFSADLIRIPFVQLWTVQGRAPPQI